MLQLAIFLMAGCSIKGIAVDDNRPYRVVLSQTYNETLVNSDRIYNFIFAPGENSTTGGGLLKYKENNTGGWHIMCWKPGCSHNTEDCPAFFAFPHRLLNLGSEGEIRILEFSQPYGLIIWEINPNRSTKTKVATYDFIKLTKYPNEFIYNMCDVCEYEQYLYVFYESAETGSVAQGDRNWIIRINLDTLKAEETICLQDIGLPEDFPVVDRFQLIENDELYCYLTNKRIEDLDHDEYRQYRIYRFSLTDYTWTDTGYETEHLFQNQLGHMVIEKYKKGDTCYLIGIDLFTGETEMIGEFPASITYRLSASQYLHRISILDTADLSMYEYDMDTGEKHDFHDSYCVAYRNGYCAFDTYTLDSSGILRIEKVSP